MRYVHIADKLPDEGKPAAIRISYRKGDDHGTGSVTGRLSPDRKEVDRYLPKMYAMYPKEWVVCQENWGADGMGIWIFLLAFSLAALLCHSLLLNHRIKEIN